MPKSEVNLSNLDESFKELKLDSPPQKMPFVIDFLQTIAKTKRTVNILNLSNNQFTNEDIKALTMVLFGKEELARAIDLMKVNLQGNGPLSSSLINRFNHRLMSLQDNKAENPLTERDKLRSPKNNEVRKPMEVTLMSPQEYHASNCSHEPMEDDLSMGFSP